MLFTKYIIVVDEDVDMHNTSEVLFRLSVNTDPQRDSILTKGPSDVLDHATSESALPREIKRCGGNWCKSQHDYLTGRGRKLGIDATKTLPGEGFKRRWPPLIRRAENLRPRIRRLC